MSRKSGLKAFAAAAFALALTVPAGYAQDVISAKSGMIHYIEGDVFVGDKAVEMKYSIFPNLKDGETLRTGEGRAEVLLTPGMFLRLHENSSMRMVSTKLTDTRVEVLSGSVLLETAELFPEYPITLTYKDQQITFKKTGLVRLDASNGVLRVYQGEAVVSRGGEIMTVKQAKAVNLSDAVLMAVKFDNKAGDEFYRWASRRANYLSIANVASAKTMYDSGSRRLSFSQWAWNPWYGMFTYIPYRGYYNSPFGYGFWSPQQVMTVVYPNYYGGGGSYNPGAGYSNSGAGFAGRYDSNLGYNVAARGANMSSGSYSGGSSSGGSVAPAASAPAASARGGDSSGDRGSSAGGRGR